MRVLITGATGYIGSAVAAAVAAAGHRVVGLAHSAAAVEQVVARGGEAVAGDLRDPAALTRIAAESDAVIHAGNVGGAEAAAVDRGATQALLRGLAGSGRALVYTSGVWVLGAGDGDERSASRAPALVGWRPALEAEVLGYAGVRGVVVRPGIVYGYGAGIPGMLAQGQLPVIGDGTQRWPLVYVEDLAELYVRALVAPAGTVLHGVAATLSMRELALLAAAAAQPPLPRISLEQARARFGAFADALVLDQQVSSQRTRAATGWQPLGPSPIEEFLAGSYAAGASAVAA